jgi:hypothetical protein
VFFLVAQSETFTGWLQVAATTPTDKLMAFMIAHLIQKTVASVLLSILPIVWLYKLLTPTTPRVQPAKAPAIGTTE